MDSVFKANPGVELLYVFPDGNAFIKKSDADGYAIQSKQEYKQVTKDKPKK